MRLKPPKETFTQWQIDNWEEDNILPPALPAQKAVNFLQSYLFGDDWYITLPLCNDQGNVEIVGEILMKYSKTYRKEFKKRMKEQKRRNNK